MEHIIEIEGLSKEYETGFWKKKRVRALDGLGLKVAGGQIFGFLGGNGAGKTTTIKILMTLLYPTSGSARILGRDISDVQMHRSIGYCPENPYFYDYLTARELMDYFGRLFGYDTAGRKNKTAQLLGAVGLEEKDWNKQLRKFSKGMLQRVGLAQSLINDPEIVFLDEPMSGLDPIGRREIRELIAGLRQKGTTVFMSTHILSDIEALCDEVAILRGGRLVATGRLDDLLTQSGENRSFEINASGITCDTFSSRLAELNGISVSDKAAGASIVVADESGIEPVLKLIRENNGKLVSVQPVKQSLEELFVKETAETK
jgi:ABC-2 type transport system ATP-binding protein